MDRSAYLLQYGVLRGLRIREAQDIWIPNKLEMWDEKNEDISMMIKCNMVCINNDATPIYELGEYDPEYN